MHGVSEDFGATISTVFDETIPTMPYLWHPICHSIPSHLRISQGSVRIHKPVQTIAVIALLRTKSVLSPKAFSMGGSFWFQRSRESRPLLHFGPQAILFFPFWHSATGTQRKRASSPPTPLSRAARRARFKSDSVAGNTRPLPGSGHKCSGKRQCPTAGPPCHSCSLAASLDIVASVSRP